MTTINTPLTFSTNGLDEKTIALLTEVDKLYFAGEKMDLKALEKAGRAIGIVKGKFTKEMIEGWDYWNWVPRPIIKESHAQPVKLSELIEIGGTAHIRNTANHKTANIKYNGPEMDLLGGLTYYFEIINEALYAKYDQIIGSRFVAYIENDIEELN